LDTHFPGNSKTDKHRVTIIPRRTPLFNRDAVQHIITEDRIKWAIGSFAPFKTPGLDGIYSVFLQKELRFLLYSICCIYRASLSSGYIPKIWREISVTFLPKPGKTDYTTAKAFRPISLTSFLLRGLEKLVDRYLRDGPLANLPIHPRQHAFQLGRSAESVLHQLVGRIKKALDAG